MAANPTLFPNPADLVPIAAPVTECLPDLSHRFISVPRGEPITAPNDLCDVIHYAAERAASVLECLAELYAHDGRLAPALDAVRFEVMDIGAVIEAWRGNVMAEGAESDRKEPDHE
jgi:hypothetical protein